MNIGKIEYRVRPVTRYIVTRFEESERGGSSGQLGEYDNNQVAFEVGYALCCAEHERLGWPPGDERIKYPTLVYGATSECPMPQVVSVTTQ